MHRFILDIIISMEMKAKNQIAIMSAIIGLIATATMIAATSYITQPAKAACYDPGPYGKQCISNEARGGPDAITGNGGKDYGQAVSGLAHRSNAHGVSDLSASGCGPKISSTSGQSNIQHGNGNVC